jgi:hypothetical protein
MARAVRIYAVPRRRIVLDLAHLNLPREKRKPLDNAMEEQPFPERV